MCPDHHTLSAYLDGELEEPFVQKIAEHLHTCENCRSAITRLQVVDRQLLEDMEPDVRASFARIWRRMDITLATFLPPRSVWRQRVGVPMAVAAVLVVGVLGLGALALAGLGNFRLMRITTEPSGVTELEIAAPIDDIERLLSSLQPGRSPQKITFEIPGEREFTIVGTPAILTENELPRRRR